MKHITAFNEVMLTGSISQAARNLHRTQPAISATISALEDELGCKLFERRGGRLHPVPEAHYLFEESAQILARLDAAERTIKSLVNLEQGTLRIVSMPGPTVSLLPQLISQFVKNRPDVNIDLVTRNSPQVYRMMLTQTYDIGIADSVVSPKMDTDTQLITQHELKFECLCALRADDPLAAREFISPGDLDGKPMAVLQSGHSTRRILRAVFEKANAHLNERFETTFFIPALTYVQNHQAYTIVDPWSAYSFREFSQGGKEVVFRRFKPAVPLGAAIITPAQRAQSRLASSFQTVMVEELQRINNLF